MRARPGLEVARPYVLDYDPAGDHLVAFLDDDHAWGVLVTPDTPPRHLVAPAPVAGLPDGVLVTGLALVASSAQPGGVTMSGVITDLEWRVDVELSTDDPATRRRVLLTRPDPWADWSDPVELVVMAGAS